MTTNSKQSKNIAIAEWHLTYKCNLACVHCNHLCMFPPQTSDMSIKHAEQFCRQATELDWRPKIFLIGGEPTLHQDFFQFLDIAAAFNPGNVWVWSNGYSVQSQEILERVRQEGKARVVESTIKLKGSVVQPQQDCFIAPADRGESRGLCKWHPFVGICGISVDSCGYTLCSAGGAIDGVLRLGLRTQRLADLFEHKWAGRHTRALCRWCGRGLGVKFIDQRATQINGSWMSPTWAQAVARICKTATS